MRNLLLLFCFAPLLLMAQTATIKGYIVDTADDPILNARVKIGDANSVFTSRDGAFSARVSLRTNANRRVKVTVEKSGYEAYMDNSLIITDSKTRILDKIVLYRIGEKKSNEGELLVTDNADIIDGNQENIEVNQEMLDKMDDLPIQYRTEIRDIQTRIDQLKPKVQNLKSTIADLEDALRAARDKDRFLQNLLTSEQTIISQQERIFGLQEAIIESISTKAAKVNISIDDANVRFVDNSTIDVTFTFKDALDKRPDEGMMQVIGLQVKQLTGGNRTKTLSVKSEGSNLQTQLLRQNVDLSKETRIRFKSRDAFKKKYRKKGFLVEFYLDGTLLGVQGYRL